MESRLDAIESRLETVDSRLGDMEEDLVGVREDVHRTWMAVSQIQWDTRRIMQLLEANSQVPVSSSSLAAS